MKTWIIWSKKWIRQIHGRIQGCTWSWTQNQQHMQEILTVGQLLWEKWKQGRRTNTEKQPIKETNQPDLPSSFSAMEFQFCGPYFSTSCLSFSSSPGRQWPLGHDDDLVPSDVFVVDEDAISLPGTRNLMLDRRATIDVNFDGQDEEQLCMIELAIIYRLVKS